MTKIYKLILSLIVALFLTSNIAPPLVYATELNSYTNKTKITAPNIEEKLSQPLKLSEEQINNMIQEKRALYPDLTEEEMREIAYKALSPYSTRASVWDGKGVTLSEFAWAFDVVVGGLISGYASIGKYVAKHGVAATRAMLSRAAQAAAKRVGVLSNFIAKLIGSAFAFIKIYYNVGYALAQFIDARDYYRNNGRINAWK